MCEVNPIILSLLSGLFGAVTVFGVGEFLRWRRDKIYHSSLLALLDEELNVISYQLTGFTAETVLITEVWDDKKVEFAKFLKADDIRELCRIYFWFHKITDNPSDYFSMDLSELRVNITKIQERLKNP